jgi:hypothetical protein
MSHYRFRSRSLNFWLYIAPPGASSFAVAVHVRYVLPHSSVILSPTLVHRRAAVSLLFLMPVHCHATISIRAASSALDTKQVAASGKYQQQQAASSLVLLNAVSASK